MLELTRRDREAQQETWLIYYGHVRVGRARRQPPTVRLAGSGPRGFYPGASGMAEIFEQARGAFEAAWRGFRARRTEAEFDEYRHDRAFHAWKQAMWAGEAMMNKAAYAVLIALASYGSAFAGSNVCYGLVKVGRGWTTVVSDYGDYAPNGCRFRTKSPLGQKILAECPDGSECEIIKETEDRPMGNEPRPIATITGEAIPLRAK